MLVYHGVMPEYGVFCGPRYVFTNDKQPRSINSDGTLKSDGDRAMNQTLVRRGASIGAHVFHCSWDATRRSVDRGVVVGGAAEIA